MHTISSQLAQFLKENKVDVDETILSYLSQALANDMEIEDLVECLTSFCPEISEDMLTSFVKSVKTTPTFLEQPSPEYSPPTSIKKCEEISKMNALRLLREIAPHISSQHLEYLWKVKFSQDLQRTADYLFEIGHHAADNEEVYRPASVAEVRISCIHVSLT